MVEKKNESPMLFQNVDKTTLSAEQLSCLGFVGKLEWISSFVIRVEDGFAAIKAAKNVILWIWFGWNDWLEDSGLNFENTGFLFCYVIIA